MDDFFALVGEKTCELTGLVGWHTYHDGVCRLLNVTHPLSHQEFQAQYREIGQQASIFCIVTVALLGVLAFLAMKLNPDSWLNQPRLTSALPTRFRQRRLPQQVKFPKTN